MTSVTSSSDASSFAAYARRLSTARPSIEINIHNHFSSKVYTTASPVSGEVIINAKRDMPFDYLQILLVGASKTRMDAMNHGAQKVTHTFLKLSMPISQENYPVPRVLEAGETYTIPFNFVIPHQLTINACNHHILSPQVQHQHVLLPPTLGGTDWEKDDMAPDMSQVQYSIKARVWREPNLNQDKIKLMETAKTIRVLPMSMEEPPLSVTKQDVLYKTEKTKSLRKNIISAKLGRLTASADQPSAVVLRPDGTVAKQPSARINLRFEPASSDVVPPKITSVTGKVTAHTFYSGGTIPVLPNIGDWNRQFAIDKRGSYSTSATLPALPVDGYSWVQSLNPTARRDSGYATDNDNDNNNSSDDSGAENNNRRGSKPRKMRERTGSPYFHTSFLDFPIRLPMEKKAFVPTFHSCIVSRVYVLQLTVSVSAGSINSNMTISLPLQVAVDGAGSPDHAVAAAAAAAGADGLPSFETAMEQAEASQADEFFLPRVLQAPAPQYMGTSTLPGYGDLMAMR